MTLFYIFILKNNWVQTHLIVLHSIVAEFFLSEDISLSSFFHPFFCEDESYLSMHSLASSCFLRSLCTQHHLYNDLIHVEFSRMILCIPIMRMGSLSFLFVFVLRNPKLTSLWSKETSVTWVLSLQKLNITFFQTGNFKRTYIKRFWVEIFWQNIHKDSIVHNNLQCDHCRILLNCSLQK